MKKKYYKQEVKRLEHIIQDKNNQIAKLEMSLQIHDKHNPNCWCSPTVELHEHSQVIVHKTDNEDWTDEHGNMPCKRGE